MSTLAEDNNTANTSAPNTGSDSVVLGTKLSSVTAGKDTKTAAKTSKTTEAYNPTGQSISAPTKGSSVFGSTKLSDEKEYYGKELLKTVQDPTRLTESLAWAVEDQSKTVVDTLKTLKDWKKFSQIKDFTDMTNGVITPKEYLGKVSSYENHLGTIAAFGAMSLAGVVVASTLPAWALVAGAVAIPVAVAGTAQTQREFGSTFLTTAEWMAVGAVTGKVESNFWLKTIGLDAKFKGVKLQNAMKGVAKAQAEFDVKINQKITSDALLIANRTGSHTAQTQAVVDSLKSGKPLTTVDVDLDTLRTNPNQIKKQMYDLIDWNKSGSREELGQQVKGLITNTQVKPNISPRETDQLATATTDLLANDPNVITIRDLYNPKNPNKNMFRSVSNDELATKTGLDLAKAKLQNAKSAYARANSNSQTLAEVLGPEAVKVNDKLIMLDKKARQYENDLGLAYVSRVMNLAGKEHLLPVRGISSTTQVNGKSVTTLHDDPTKSNMWSRIAVHMHGKNSDDVRLLPKKYTENEYYFNKDGSVKDFLTPVESQIESTMRALYKTTKGRLFAASENLNNIKLIDRGDYYIPRKYDRDDIPGDLVDVMIGTVGSQAEGVSLTESVGKHITNYTQGTLRTNALDSMLTYVKQASRMISLSENGAKEALNTLSFMGKHVDANFGADVGGMWRKFSRVSLVGEKPAQGMDAAALYWTHASTSMIISGKPVKLAVQQTGALINTVTNVGLEDTLAAGKILWTKMGQNILTRDSHFMSRVMDASIEKNQLSKGWGRGMWDAPMKTAKFAADVRMSLPKYTDKQVAGIAYLAGYLKSMRLNPGNIELAQLMGTKSMTATQGSSQQLFRPHYQLESAFGKVAGTFQSQTSAQYNASMQAWAKYKSGSLNEFDMFKQILGNQILPAVFQGMVDIKAAEVSAKLLGGPEQQDDAVSQTVWRSARQVFPIFGSLINGAAYDKQNHRITFIGGKPIELVFNNFSSYQKALESGDNLQLILDSIRTSVALTGQIDIGNDLNTFKYYLGVD